MATLAIGPCQNKTVPHRMTVQLIENGSDPNKKNNDDLPERTHASSPCTPAANSRAAAVPGLPGPLNTPPGHCRVGHRS